MRRTKILDAAEQVFCRVGFADASMISIACIAGCSKATLYSYFASKHDLFLEVLLSAGRSHFKDAIRELTTTHDMFEGLTRLGTAYLAFRSAPRSVALLRLVIAESARSSLGSDFYHAGPGRFVAELMRALPMYIERGDLIAGDCALMAQHLKALIESSLLERCLLAEIQEAEMHSLREQVHTAVAAFVRSYSPSSADRAGAAPPVRYITGCVSED